MEVFEKLGQPAVVVDEHGMVVLWRATSYVELAA
jgi:hypothetical protein